MTANVELVHGNNCFTLLELLEKAAAQKGLNLLNSSSKAYSEPIKTYVLDEKLLALLAEQGIKRQDRHDCHHEIFTLVDENPQDEIKGWVASNYWNFKLLEDESGKGKFDLQIKLCVGFSLSPTGREIKLVPIAIAPFLSPVDSLPNFRMFKALVDSDEIAPLVAKEIAASEGSIAVTWTHLGVAGIRTLAVLFEEFAGDNEKVKELARRQEVFKPAPYSRNQQPGYELFVVETAQPEVFRAWMEQLNTYRSALAIRR